MDTLFFIKFYKNFTNVQLFIVLLYTLITTKKEIVNGHWTEEEIIRRDDVQKEMG